MRSLRPWRAAMWIPLLAGVAAYGATLADGREVEPLADGAIREPLPGAAAPRRAPDTPASALRAVVQRDLFRPDRSPPAQRYQLPGSSADPAAAPAPTFVLPRNTPLTGAVLHGTVAYGGGRGLAAISLPGRPPRLLRTGEALEGFRLTRVDGRGATLVHPDTTIVLHTPGSPNPPGPR